MANQPLAFAELLAGGILVTAALTGSKLRDVVAGDAGPFKGFDIGGGGGAAAATPAIGSLIGSAQGGSPIPGEKPHTATHQTAGLAGYPAYDYMAKAGSAVVAPVTGTVIQLSGHDPAMGPTNGPHGPFGWSVYIKDAATGAIYYLTHLGSRVVKMGQTVTQGQQIGTVGNYAAYGGANHVHQGIHIG